MKKTYLTGNRNGKPKVLCLATADQAIPFDEQTYEVTRLDSAATGVNRIGLEDFDLIVIDTLLADRAVLNALMAFLRHTSQNCLLITEHEVVGSRVPMVARSHLGQLDDRMARLIPVPA